MCRYLVMPAVGSCFSTPTLPGGAAGPIAISKPVGQGQLARNLPDDVKTIQEALNQVTVKGEAGGPMPFLAVDGIVGPKTRAAIFNFQQVQVKSIKPDGLVEPGKQTIQRLNEIVGPANLRRNEIAAPPSKYDLNAKLATSLPLVRIAITAAIHNLVAVITSAPGAALAQDRLNRHFKLNTLDASRQSQFTRILYGTYSLMWMVVERPELLGMIGTIEVFDMEPGNPSIAYTPAGRGVFEPPRVNGEDNRKRHIYLGLGFFKPDVTADYAVFILTHELAHFTGRSDGTEIGEDKGRGWVDDRDIKRLSATDRLVNADSYATFATECRTGSAGKPVYVTSSPGGQAGRRR